MFMHIIIVYYNNEQQLLKHVGQSNNPTGAFYLPTGIKQFESHKGLYFWLNNNNLQILREYNGQLVKSVAVTANNFIIDSTDKFVLINNATKELNYFTADGTLVDQTPLDNLTADPPEKNLIYPEIRCQFETVSQSNNVITFQVFVPVFTTT